MAVPALVHVAKNGNFLVDVVAVSDTNSILVVLGSKRLVLAARSFSVMIHEIRTETHRRCWQILTLSCAL